MPLHIVFMGTPDFAVPTLETLLALPPEVARVVAVVTAPDRPAGRGQQLQASAVKTAALAHGLPVLQPERLKAPEFVEALRGYGADLQVIVAFRMLPEVVWNMPARGSVNIHASLLPQYRGAAPINWALIHGETETGVTSFFLRHEIDTGDLILQDRVPIAPDDNFGTLYDKLKVAGAALAARTVRAIAAGQAPSTPQPALPDLRPAPKLTKETGRLDFRQPAAALVNLVRGLAPAPAAYCTLPDGRLLKVFRASAGRFGQGEAPAPGFWYGSRRFLSVATAEGWLHLLEVQAEGKKRLAIEAFLRGDKMRDYLGS